MRNADGTTQLQCRGCGETSRDVRMVDVAGGYFLLPYCRDCEMVAREVAANGPESDWDED